MDYYVVPPLGIFMISGCSVDLCVNILLTLLGLVHTSLRWSALDAS